VGELVEYIIENGSNALFCSCKKERGWWSPEYSGEKYVRRVNIICLLSLLGREEKYAYIYIGTTSVR
jgi:hypothetical protein